MNSFMKRINLTITILILIIFICISGNTLNNNLLFDHITLTWTQNSSTTITITWRTSLKIKNGLVQYQKINSSNSVKYVKAHLYVFKTDIETYNLFTATVSDLLPNTKYIYRVGNGTSWSDRHTFSTSGTKISKFKFLIFGDSQSIATCEFPYTLWSKTIHKAYKSNPDAKFIVNVGDLVDIGQSIVHWNAWFAGAKGVIDSIPIIPVIGNHETFSINDMGKPTFWNSQFNLPKNGPIGLKNQVYSFDYGNVHFVVLDSQMSEQIRYGNILIPQKKWLDKDLSQSKSTWKIVFFHKPPYCLLPTRQNIEIKESFCPIIDKHHVDIVFNGHDHGVARTYPIKNNIIMKEPSQGTIYYITGRSGIKVYKNIKKDIWHCFFYNPIDQPNYLVVEVDKIKLTIKIIKLDGTIIDTFSIYKK